MLASVPDFDKIFDVIEPTVNVAYEGPKFHPPCHLKSSDRSSRPRNRRAQVVGVTLTASVLGLLFTVTAARTRLPSGSSGDLKPGSLRHHDRNGSIVFAQVNCSSDSRIGPDQVRLIRIKADICDTQRVTTVAFRSRQGCSPCY